MAETVSPYAPPAMAEVPPPEKKRCVECATLIEFEAKTCVSCRAVQAGKECVVCGARIPRWAVRCSSCSAFQGWLRRRFPASEVSLALLLSLISVTSALIPQAIAIINRPSKTNAVFLAVAADAAGRTELVVRAYNSGGLPSVVERVDLAYPAAGLARASLKIVNYQDIDVPSHGKTDLRLGLKGGLHFAQSPAETAEADNEAKEKLAATLCITQAIFELSIAEANRYGKVTHAARTVRVPVAGQQIRDWIMPRVRGAKPKGGC